MKQVIREFKPCIPDGPASPIHRVDIQELLRNDLGHCTFKKSAVKTPLLFSGENNKGHDPDRRAKGDRGGGGDAVRPEDPQSEILAPKPLRHPVPARVPRDGQNHRSSRDHQIALLPLCSSIIAVV